MPRRQRGRSRLEDCPAVGFCDEVLASLVDLNNTDLWLIEDINGFRRSNIDFRSDVSGGFNQVSQGLGLVGAISSRSSTSEYALVFRQTHNVDGDLR